MELRVKRQIKSDKSTIGDFSVNGQIRCNCLEDTDRDLTSSMTLKQIAGIKIHGLTAIPTGRYQVVKYFSPKHGGWAPLLLHVPGFNYAEIHAGNKPEDTDGCLLLGDYDSATPDWVSSSRAEVTKFYPEVFAALDKGEQVWITYE